MSTPLVTPRASVLSTPASSPRFTAGLPTFAIPASVVEKASQVLPEVPSPWQGLADGLRPVVADGKLQGYDLTQVIAIAFDEPIRRTWRLDTEGNVVGSPVVDRISAASFRDEVTPEARAAIDGVYLGAKKIFEEITPRKAGPWTVSYDVKLLIEDTFHMRTGQVRFRVSSDGRLLSGVEKMWFDFDTLATTPVDTFESA
jgi:hypothetical protein